MIPREKAAEIRLAARQSLLWSLRFRTLLLVLLAVVPALALMVYSAEAHRHLAQVQTRENTQRLARLAAADAEGRMDSARGFLGVLAHLPEVRAREADACNTTFRHLLVQHPDYANIGAATPDGNIYASAVPLEKTVNIKDRLYFQRALATRRFAVGSYQIGRVTKEPTVNFGYPVLDSKGRVSSIVFVALQLDWLVRFAEWRLPTRSTLSIFDHTGQILLHYPDPDRWIGRRIQNIVPVAITDDDPGGTIETTALDGVPRLLAYSPLPRYRNNTQSYVSISLPLDVVYANIDRIFMRNILGLGIVAALALLAAWVGGDLFFLRQVSALIRTAKRLSRGDLTARTGSHYGRDELSQLTWTFDEMADSLEHLTGRYELILSSAGEGIYGVDTKGTATFVNPAAARMLGYEPGELVGMPHHQTIHHSNPDGTPYPQEDCPVTATIRDGAVHRGDNEIFWRKDGSFFPVDYVATPAREHGEIVGAVVAFKDITERRQAEQAVEAAHEEVVKSALEKKRFYREVIRSVTRDKLHLVESIAVPDGAVPVFEGALETPQDDRIARHHLRTIARDAGMTAETANHLIHAAGEATTNAVKHATHGRVVVYRAPDRLIVRVSDRGAGISTDNLPASLLQAGFSTKVSMGVGYTMMLELADRVWLSTGPDGTVVQLEKWIQPEERPASPLTEAVERIQSTAASSS